MGKQETINAVKSLRTALCETQQQFALRTGTAVRTVARWETDRAPSGRMLVHLAKLATDNGYGREASVFSEAFVSENGYGLKTMQGRKMNRDLNNTEQPTNDAERAMVAEALCLYRNRDLIPEWREKDAWALSALEDLAKRSENNGNVHTENEALRDVLAWARLRREGEMTPKPTERSVPIPASAKKVPRKAAARKDLK